MSIWTKPASSKFTSFVSVVAMLAFLPLFLLAVYKSVQLISRAAGTAANIIIDAGAVLEPINTDFYHAFAQGGEESTDMLAPVASQIKALSPDYIRIDHVFDHYDVVSGSGGSISFNFSKLDGVIDTILSTGAKPVIALSYMPSSIAKDGIIINPPNNWDDWARVIEETIRHYSGTKNIANIFYEVWNEPDLAQFGSWKMGGDKNYLTLYHYASIGASRVSGVNRFFLGGPATTGLYRNWMTGIAGSGNRIDFFSWHTYLADPRRYMQDQQNFITWMTPYPSLVIKPTLITEYGFTGDKSTLYGTTYAAAHAAAIIRQLISGGPMYIFSFEPVDGPNQESGSGWGLITHPANGKKPKPRYYVYNFIDQMKGNRLQVTGEGTWVTGFASQNNDIRRLLLINFDKSGSHTENVPVAFINLIPGTYNWRERVLFGRDAVFEETANNGEIKRDVYMSAQTIAIIEISKKQ